MLSNSTPSNGIQLQLKTTWTNNWLISNSIYRGEIQIISEKADWYWNVALDQFIFNNAGDLITCAQGKLETV